MENNMAPVLGTVYMDFFKYNYDNKTYVFDYEEEHPGKLPPSPCDPYQYNYTVYFSDQSWIDMSYEHFQIPDQFKAYQLPEEYQVIAIGNTDKDDYKDVYILNSKSGLIHYSDDVTDNIINKKIPIFRQYKGPNFHRSAMEGNYHNVLLFINNGYDVNVKDSEWGGQTALTYAACSGHIEIARLLISNGADVNARAESTGMTPLFCASTLGHIEVVELLINNNADINIKDGRGHTPIYGAIISRHQNTVKLLIEEGADTNYRTVTGLTLYELAEERNYNNIAQMLKTDSKKR